MKKETLNKIDENLLVFSCLILLSMVAAVLFILGPITSIKTYPQAKKCDTNDIYNIDQPCFNTSSLQTNSSTRTYYIPITTPYTHPEKTPFKILARHKVFQKDDNRKFLDKTNCVVYDISPVKNNKQVMSFLCYDTQIKLILHNVVNSYEDCVKFCTNTHNTTTHITAKEFEQNQKCECAKKLTSIAESMLFTRNH